MIEAIEDIDWDWIENNRDCDTIKLRLNAHKGERSMTDFAILQIECRRKAAKKLPITLKHKKFLFPTALSAEQCTSDRLAAYHSSLVPLGAKILDMTSGLGIDVFHFASRADKITAIDINPDIAKILQQNSQTLGINNITAVNADSCDFIQDTSNHYDMIFIDPARRGNNGRRLFALSDCEPNVTAILPSIKAKCDKLIVKASPMLDITQTLRELPNATDIYVIGTVQECKELVIVSDFKSDSKCINIHAVTLTNTQEIDLSYNILSEENASVRYNSPQVEEYIYEPYPAVMKAAPFKYLSQKYEVDKLHINTHLYTSKKRVIDFPGDIFKIECIIPFSSKEIKHFAKQYPQINIAVRNFFMSADELRKKLKVKDGGDKKAIGCTTTDGSKIILIVSRVHKYDIISQTFVP